MARGLPKPVTAVGRGMCTQRRSVANRAMCKDPLGQSATCEFPEVNERLIESAYIAIRIKDDGMHVCGHQDKSVDSQVLRCMTETQTFANEIQRRLRDEDREPINHGIRDKVHGGFVGDAVTFHQEGAFP